MPCQPGSISSQIPAGRSKRPSFNRPQGRRRWRSTQLVAAASGRMAGRSEAGGAWRSTQLAGGGVEHGRMAVSILSRKTINWIYRVAAVTLSSATRRRLPSRRLADFL
jgi:hypothetical protein